jgi:hypothetical protein
MSDLPATIVVDENGNYWRAFDGFYSMCPVSTDNDPVKVAAIYTRLAATPAPLDGHQTPGEYHDYRVACVKCGEPGFLHVSWRPEKAEEKTDGS